MRQLGLSVEPESYFDIVPWQTLSVINLEFIFAERRRNYLKFAGGLCYFEVGAQAAVIDAAAMTNLDVLVHALVQPSHHETASQRVSKLHAVTLRHLAS